jgi:hypothetical protein
MLVEECKVIESKVFHAAVDNSKGLSYCAVML